MFKYTKEQYDIDLARYERLAKERDESVKKLTDSLKTTIEFLEKLTKEIKND